MELESLSIRLNKILRKS